MVKGYNRGGEVPIIAQEGEYVMSRQAVNSIGRGTMEAINKYHSGGLVQYRQTGGAASTGPIVTGTDVGQLQQVQSFNTLAKIGKDQIGATTKIGENQIGATNNISTNVVNKLDTLNKNIKDVRGISAIGFTVLNKNIASIDARIFDIYLHTMGIDWVEDEIETLQDINKKIQGINKKILNKVRAIAKVGAGGAGAAGAAGGAGGAGGPVGPKGIKITNIAQLQAVINTFGAVTNAATNELGRHMSTYGAVTSQLGTHMSTFGSAVNQFSTSINNIPEQINIQFSAPLQVEGMEGFSQAVANRVVVILKNMGLGQDSQQQNSAPPLPGKEL